MIPQVSRISSRINGIIVIYDNKLKLHPLIEAYYVLFINILQQKLQEKSNIKLHKLKFKYIIILTYINPNSIFYFYFCFMVSTIISISIILSRNLMPCFIIWYFIYNTNNSIRILYNFFSSHYINCSIGRSTDRITHFIIITILINYQQLLFLQQLHFLFPNKQKILHFHYFYFNANNHLSYFFYGCSFPQQRELHEIWILLLLCRYHMQME